MVEGYQSGGRGNDTGWRGWFDVNYEPTRNSFILCFQHFPRISLYLPLFHLPPSSQHFSQLCMQFCYQSDSGLLNWISTVKYKVIFYIQLHVTVEPRTPPAICHVSIRRFFIISFNYHHLSSWSLSDASFVCKNDG